MDTTDKRKCPAIVGFMAALPPSFLPSVSSTCAMFPEHRTSEVLLSYVSALGLFGPFNLPCFFLTTSAI